MKDIYIDPYTKDILVTNESFRLTSDNLEYIAQVLDAEFHAILGEWFLDYTFGIDRKILFKKNYDQNLIVSMFLAIIKSHDEVAEIIDYDATLDVSRTFIFNANVRLISGETGTIGTTI